MGLTEAWSDGFGDQPSDAGSFKSSSFGLFDVHGNVMEYCRDHYLNDSNPVQEGTGMRLGTSGDRMVRGGNFRSPASGARSAKRLPVGPGPRNRDVGFRPSLDLE
jgi:formylglycine-generating enzyme required for sulfatase activity